MDKTYCLLFGHKWTYYIINKKSPDCFVRRCCSKCHLVEDSKDFVNCENHSDENSYISTQLIFKQRN